jgi:3-hydroxyisobutyrate dehydrogenase-like beta-hydroxyacid dehydrogenase
MLHGFAICEAEGIDIDVYAKSMPAITGLLTYTADLAARMIPERTYPGSEATNDIHIAALAHIARASRDAGVDPYPETTLAYFKKAQALGHGGDEIPAIYEAMRARR